MVYTWMAKNDSQTADKLHSRRGIAAAYLGDTAGKLVRGSETVIRQSWTLDYSSIGGQHYSRGLQL